MEGDVWIGLDRLGWSHATPGDFVWLAFGGYPMRRCRVTAYVDGSVCVHYDSRVDAI